MYLLLLKNKNCVMHKNKKRGTKNKRENTKSW